MLFSHKAVEIQPSPTIWMDLEVIMLSEISQTEKDKYCMFSLMYGILKKKQKQNLKETESRMVVARHLGAGEMGKCWSKCTNFQL